MEAEDIDCMRNYFMKKHPQLEPNMLNSDMNLKLKRTATSTMNKGMCFIRIIPYKSDVERSYALVERISTEDK